MIERTSKDESLKDKVERVFGYKTDCPECGEPNFSSEVLKERIVPWIEYCKRNNVKHPVEQLEDEEELALAYCKECGESVDFRL